MRISEWKQYNYWNVKEGYIAVRLGHQNLIFLYPFHPVLHPPPLWLPSVSSQCLWKLLCFFLFPPQKPMCRLKGINYIEPQAYNIFFFYLQAYIIWETLKFILVKVQTNDHFIIPEHIRRWIRHFLESVICNNL